MLFHRQKELDNAADSLLEFQSLKVQSSRLMLKSSSATSSSFCNLNADKKIKLITIKIIPFIFFIIISVIKL